MFWSYWPYSSLGGNKLNTPKYSQVFNLFVLLILTFTKIGWEFVKTLSDREEQQESQAPCGMDCNEEAVVGEKRGGSHKQ